VGSRASMDKRKMRKIFSTLAVQPVTSRYTNCTIPAPVVMPILVLTQLCYIWPEMEAAYEDGRVDGTGSGACLTAVLLNLKDSNTQNYRISGLWPSFGILNTRKHDGSETGSVSALRWGEGKTHTLLGPLERANLKGPNRVGVFPSPHLRTETDLVFETLCFLVFRILDDGQSPQTQ
jgi:hypothetical protein